MPLPTFTIAWVARSGREFSQTRDAYGTRHRDVLEEFLAEHPVLDEEPETYRVTNNATGEARSFTATATRTITITITPSK